MPDGVLAARRQALIYLLEGRLAHESTSLSLRHEIFNKQRRF